MRPARTDDDRAIDAMIFIIGTLSASLGLGYAVGACWGWVAFGTIVLAEWAIDRFGY